jgi:Zn-dependent protease
MLGWSMNLFRVRGIMLAVHATFFALLATAAFLGWSEGGWNGALWYAAALLAMFVCIVLHELGHCFTALHYGIGVRRILLLPIGGMAEFESIPREPRRELLITFAGPAVNFAIAGVLWLVLPAGSPVETEEMTLVDFGHLLVQWNLLMGAFNFIPAFPMDGGRILRALLATRLDYVRATLWAASIAKVVCVIAIAVAIYYEHWLSAALFAFIVYVGEMEYRAVRRREIEEAHWREVAARFHLVNEPPLLTGTTVDT